MLATQIEVSDGTLNIINVGIEFFNQTDISVSLDQSDLPLVLGVDYQWSAATTIQFLNTVGTPGGLVPNGVEVIIRRSTESEDMFNIYVGGAPFSRLTLDENFEQLLFLAQEFREGLGLDGLRNNLNMNGYRVTNLGTPVNPSDAATKAYVDSKDTAQQLYVDNSIAKTLRVPENIPGLPSAASRANRVLAFNSSGDPIVAIPTSGSVGDFAIDLANNTDPAKGAAMVGWFRDTLATKIDNAADVFNSMHVNVREKEHLVVKPNPLDPSTWNWSPAIQAAVDQAELLGLACVTCPGVLRLETPISLGDNSRLCISPGTTLLKDFEGLDTWTGTIRGKGNAIAHSNIEIFGGGTIKSASGRVGKHIVFFNSSFITIHNIKIRDTFSDWTTKFQNCTDVIIYGNDTNVGSTQVLTDGWHFKGASKRVVIANNLVLTGDDCIAFTQEVAPVDEAGDCEDIVVCNNHLTTGQSSLVKIHVRVGITTRVRRVNISNNVGRVGRINAGGFSFYFTDDNLAYGVSDIRVTSHTGYCIENGDYCARIVGCRDVVVDGFTAYEALRGFLVEDSRYITVTNPRIHPLRGTGGQVSSSIIFQNVDWGSIDNPRVSGSGQHGIQLGAAGKPARYINVSGGTSYSHVSTGVRLTNADGCSVSGLTSYGNNNGIVEDAGSDNNRLFFNDVRSNTTTSMAVAGAGTKVSKNVGYLDQNSGQATIGAASTTVVVSHGLPAQPSTNNIRLTALNSLGSAMKYFVSGINATTFTINVDVVPGGAGAIFGWSAALGSAI